MITDAFVVMVCGSRGWKDERAIRDALVELPAKPDLLIHGGAEGADTIAARVARFLGIRTEQYLPLKSIPSPQRYHVRNDEMLDDATFVLAFWDGQSRGTKSVIDKAKARGLPYRVVPNQDDIGGREGKHDVSEFPDGPPIASEAGRASSGSAATVKDTSETLKIRISLPGIPLQDIRDARRFRLRLRAVIRALGRELGKVGRAS